jgi:Zn finger protein HypA/HybF involved in hydrogenase expression
VIAKERKPADYPKADHPTTIAGAEAEKQLAHYLGRAFAEAPGLAILNDLRLVAPGGEVAQIDHLVVHPCGAIVVESKSITGKIRINKQREWVRVTARGEEGMPDAVEQARRQRDVLRHFLRRNESTILDTSAITIADLGFDVLAAISDKGVIERDLAMPKVVKADQVPARVKEIMVKRWTIAKQAAPGDPEGCRKILTQSEFDNLVRLLVGSHSPRRVSRTTRVTPKAARVPARPKPERRPMSEPTSRPTATKAARARRCPACGGTTLEMRWGNRPKGYYFHCLGCEKNWRPDAGDRTCPTCRRPDVRLRKSKDVMLLDCPNCGHAGVFHRNR